MERFDALEMLEQRRLQPRRQHGHAILAALALPNGDLMAREVKILNPEAQALHQPKTGAIQQRGDQAQCTLHLVEHPLHFVPAQDHGQLPGNKLARSPHKVIR